MSTTHPRSNDGSASPLPEMKKQRLDPRTFRNRAGELQATHDWPLDDSIVALRAPANAAEADAHPWGEGTGFSCIFLASRNILCRDSQVFKGILTIPQTQSPQELELYEGHPVVDVQDDPQDLQDFLEAVHDYVEFSLSSKYNQAPSLAAVLRLSHKYGVPKLRRKILPRLQPLVPTTLKELREHEKEPPSVCATPMDSAHLLQALEITGDLPVFLPFLYYHYALGGWSHFALWKARVSDNPPGKDADGEERVWLWSEMARMRVIQMHGNCMKLGIPTMQTILSGNTRQCDNPATCPYIGPPFVYDDVTPPPSWVQPIIDYSCPIFSLPPYDSTIEGLCNSCKPVANARREVFLEHLWQALPSLIGLENWETLRAQSIVDVESSSSNDAE